MPKLGDLEEFLMFSGLASRTGRWPDLREPQQLLPWMQFGGTCICYSMGGRGYNHERSQPVTLSG